MRRDLQREEAAVVVEVGGAGRLRAAGAQRVERVGRERRLVNAGPGLGVYPAQLDLWLTRALRHRIQTQTGQAAVVVDKRASAFL